MKGNSGTDALHGGGLGPLAAVKTKPEVERPCTRLRHALSLPSTTVALAPRHLCPACPPPLSLCARAGGEAEAEAGGGRMEGGAL